MSDNPYWKNQGHHRHDDDSDLGLEQAFNDCTKLTQSNQEDSCPQCGGQLVYDEVDVGVGTIRGNPGCPDCHWIPDDPYTNLAQSLQ